MIVLAMPIVQLLLQSGKFQTRDAELAAQVLCWFAIGIFAWSAHAILTRGFYALQETHTPIIVGTVITFLFILLCYPLKAQMGVNGLALATSIAATIHMLAMLFLLRRRLKGLDDAVLIRSVSKIVVATLITAALCWGVRVSVDELCFQFPMPVFLRSGIVLATCTLSSATVYALLAVQMRMEEFRPIKQKIRKLLDRVR
jgi:putative peptidoglycan lipid II flippase